jgi:geranylgeranyl pyrophosphate synthase
MMLLVHRDMASRQARNQWGVIIGADGQARACPEFLLEQDGIWNSPATEIRYPSSARITIPGETCFLRIDPLSPDQELPVPGPMRAIWEGVCGVSGSWGGQPVRGYARVELCGYGYIFDFEQVLSPISRKIDRTILRYFPPSLDNAGIARLMGNDCWEGESQVYSEMIARPAHDLMQRARKYYRPLYAILLLKALGVDPAPYFDLLCIIPELTHTGALIIDDIEDNSRIRRGGPCIHIRYGIDSAINAGNMLYYLPWLLVEDHPHLDDPQRLLLYKHMVRSSVKVHIGQATDLFWSHQASSSRILALSASGIDRKVLQMHADKTGVAGEQVAYGCCIIARSPRDVMDASIRFSRSMWIAFQIIDDTRDIVGGSTWHKIPGGDIAQGKMSSVIAKALMLLEGTDQARLAEILAMPPGQKDEGVISEAISLVKASGAVGLCRQEVEKTVVKEWKRFSPFIPASEAKVMLRVFCQRMIRERG